MKKRTKYYLIGFIVLVGGIIGYHYLAASQAEQQIDKTIQEQTLKNDSLSVQYSSIDVAPFGGQISVRDLTIIFGNHIERTVNLHLNISYFDFLNIYFGGLEYGLDQLRNAQLTAIRPTYVSKSGLEEFKADSLVVTFEGHALSGLRSAVNDIAFTNAQTVNIESNGITISLPQTTFRKITADNLQYSGTIDKGQRSFWAQGNHQFEIDTLTWTPSNDFQDKYRFFIEGFGYSSNAIPFHAAHLHSTPAQQVGLLKIESSIRSELALLSTSGFLQLQQPTGRSQLRDMKITISDFSDTFSRILTNAERLLSISLPQQKDGTITLPLEGTVSNPRIAQ